MTQTPDTNFSLDAAIDPDDRFIPGEQLTRLALLRFDEAAAGQGGAAPAIPFSEKSKNEAAIRTILQELEDALASWQGRQMDQLTPEEMDGLEAVIQEHLLRLDEGRYLFDEPFLAFFIDRGYMEAAKSFIVQTRAQDGGLTSAEIFQALRNVWIMNSLQLMWAIPLAITPSVYAYSLLYPYTDNYLDDPAVAKSDKSAFNELIRQALQGIPQSSEHPASARVLELIAMIRSQYEPGLFPQVSASIRLIQAAQTDSLRQDQKSRLPKADLLRLSFRKGGASVLADAFLVKGSLSPAEIEFAFLYGSFLQLVDDLQDARSDRAEEHQTLFSGPIPDDRLDDTVRQLIGFIRRINGPDPKDSPLMIYMKKVIGACSHLMVLDVLGRDAALVSPVFYDELETSCKVRLAFFKEMAEMLKGFSAGLETRETGPASAEHTIPGP